MSRTVDFCFFLVENFSDENVVAVRRFVEELAHQHGWAWGPPEFVDTTDDSSCTQPGDLPIRSLGGVVSNRGDERRPGGRQAVSPPG